MHARPGRAGSLPPSLSVSLSLSIRLSPVPNYESQLLIGTEESVWQAFYSAYTLRDMKFSTVYLILFVH